jgi:hypothetical protein
MRSMALRKLFALVVVAAPAALALAAGTPALAAASSGSGCQAIPGLTEPELCVSVQAESSSVQPGGTADYLVQVSVTGGVALDVTVSLGASSSGTPVFTSSCIVGANTSHCWIATMGVLGSPTTDQMQARVPPGPAGSTLTLTATAVVPTLVLWTPPSASASMAVATPPTASSSPTPSASAPSSASADPSPTASPSSPAVSPTTAATGSGGSALPGAVSGTLPTGRSGSVSGAGSASGLFPAVSGSPSPAAQTEQADPVAYSRGLPMGQVAIGIGAALLLGWAAVVGPRLYRRKRGTRQAS